MPYYLPERSVLKAKNCYLLQNGNCLVEVVMFHCGRAVDGSKWRLGVQHELIIFPSVVQIVTKGGNVQCQTL